MKTKSKDIHLKAEKQIEQMYFKKSRNKGIYTALEEVDHDWPTEQIKDVRYLWRKGASLMTMAEYFKREEEEVLLIVTDQILKGFLKKRKNGLLGEY